jgi:hypothetical protein
MTLVEKQAYFSSMVAKLIQQAQTMGFQVTLGEAWRPKETAQLYAKDGRGIKDSNHTLRLAIDLNLFRGGILCTNPDDYEPLGVWWEKQSSPDIECCWGGRFLDADHFSLENNGVK